MESYSEFLREIREQLASGKAEAAAQLCQQSLGRWPEDEELSYLLALAEEKSGQDDAARKRLDQIVAANPERTDIRFDLGRLLAADGRIDQARKHLEACIKQDPGHAPAWTVLARMHRFEGDRDKAISGLKTALRADANHVPALVSLAELMLEINDAEAANDYASRAIQTEPEDAMAQLALARVFVAKGLHGFADRCLANATRLAHENAHVLNTAGHLYQRMGKHAAAAESFAAARQLGLADSSNASAFAISLASMGRMREARQVIRLISAEALDPELIRDVSELALHSGDVDALEELSELSAQTGLPDELQLWTQALLAHAKGDLTQSLELSRQLLGSSDPELVTRVRIEVARTSLQADQSAEVAAVLEPIVGEKRLSPAAHWEIANLFRLAGRPELAIDTLRSLLDRPRLGHEQATLTRARLVDLLDQTRAYGQAAELLDQTGWQRPYLGETAYLEVDEAAGQRIVAGFNAMDRPASDQPDGAAQMVFVGGWPCTGRDLIVSALATSESITALPHSDWARRKERLGLPVDPGALADRDPFELHAKRRAYLRGYSGRSIVLEPAAVQALDLALLARLFPGAVFVHPVADSRYLKMQWRLLGYRQVPTMFRAWQRELELMAEFGEALPLRIVECRLEALLEDPRAALAPLCAELGIQFHDSMTTAVQAASEQGRYRAPDHWKHYQPED
ncbi:tetratricopeptide repeat protein [Wenzhouxiangella sp. XN201]|nr:tetratricopeptide repeat protein [Wenzhouxiangella sp. XN201]